MEVTSQHHQSMEFNFRRFLGTRFLDAMLNHPPVRFTLHFGAKSFLSASIASEAFDFSYQLKRPLMAFSVQSAAKSIQSNWRASIKIANQIMIDIGFQTRLLLSLCNSKFPLCCGLHLSQFHVNFELTSHPLAMTFHRPNSIRIWSRTLLW